MRGNEGGGWKSAPGKRRLSRLPTEQVKAESELDEELMRHRLRSVYWKVEKKSDRSKMREKGE